MVSGILIAMAVVGAVGLFIGLFLGIAGIKFKVEVDEREEAVLSALPGNNCGGCGYAGCANLAAAIAKGEAPVNACPVGGEPVGKEIAKIMGVEAGKETKKVAFVACREPAIRRRQIMSIMESLTVRCFPLSRTAVRNPVIMVVPVSVIA